MNQTKKKLISILLIVLLLYNDRKVKDCIKPKNEYLINEYKNYSQNFLKLREISSDYNYSLLAEEKENILNFISKAINKNVSSIKKIIYSGKARFGNLLIILNKLIFFCEVIKCKEITLKNNRDFWFIRNRIYLRENDIAINIIDTNNYKDNNINHSEIIFLDTFDIFYYLNKIKPKIRINLLRDEIMKNLFSLNVSNRDLYIHIRSGDIFRKNAQNYAQPPLCFYTSIFKNFQFNKIYLISQDKSNYVINRLLNKFNNIIYSEKSLKYDISSLINAYNLVGSISSFLNMLIVLNSNLENFWEYNMIKVKQKISLHHHDLFKYPNKFTIYKMDASSIYKNKMYVWHNNKMQQKLMMKEKCINSFMIVRSNI
jgi:hypothetical protein